ncbi:phosphoglycerate dehydrogenase [Bowdeniella nasicola]|uniref:Phosphoglycerate dehydrogenase n=1 Tax=Bowdeniella nasicola TaxID=208480 RepID=A0A1Q5Q4L3_9ACTO|nr:NAD(P)-dependent oxidoreductase [Bowdeniella nasicola]OKL54746.1 phosphoglycerate dehydrogenase [Bowdeniella nasicola]
MKILVPDDVVLDLNLPKDEIASYTFGEPIAETERDADAIVMWGFGHRWLNEVLPALPNLRWIQTLAAGPDALLASGAVPTGVEITTGRGFHDRTVAEHALGMTLALVRRLPDCLDAQADHRWASEIGGSQPLHPGDRITTLINANVLVWGFGSIGSRIADVFSVVGAKVRGVARSAGERHGYEVLTEDYVDAALAETDVLVMVLPTSKSTNDALDARRLVLLPKHAFVINVGRATTWNEADVIDALKEGQIAGAATDVTSKEPLPDNSPLWDAPNLLITPHAAGGRPDNPEPTIEANAEAIRTGRLADLINRVEL